MTDIHYQRTQKIGSKFMIVNLKTVDKDGELDLPKDVIFNAVEKFRERALNTGVIFVTVGPTEANIVVNIPETRNETNVKDWTDSLGVTDSFVVTDKIFKFQTFNVTEKKKVDWSSNCSETHITKPLDEGEFLKYRDDVINKGFSFLRTNGLLPEFSLYLYDNILKLLDSEEEELPLHHCNI